MNLLLIEDESMAYQMCDNNKSENTMLVRFSEYDTIEADLQISHIALVFDVTPVIPIFIKDKIKSIIDRYKPTNVDFLGCKTLMFTAWNNSYDELKTLSPNLIIWAAMGDLVK